MLVDLMIKLLTALGEYLTPNPADQPGRIHDDDENNPQHQEELRSGQRRPLRRPVPRLQEVDHRPDQEAVAARRKPALPPLREEGMVKAKTALDPIQVQCAACLALPGEHCSTRCSSHPVAPHPARARLARLGVACPRCRVSELRACVSAKGEAQPRIHTARIEAAQRAAQRETIDGLRRAPAGSSPAAG